MKKTLCALLALMMCLSLFVGCAPANNNTTTTPSTPNTDPNAALAGTYDVKIWVSETTLDSGESVVNTTEAQIKAFEAAYPGIKINASIEGVSEGNAASQVLNDVASAPDIYGFAQDQLARLVQANALAPLGKGAAETITANNDRFSVNACKVGGDLYAYPMTSDNGYFMYYDKSIISEEDAKDLASIVAAAEAAGKKVRYALENAWYTASFFFATGCTSSWTTDQDGKYTSVQDDFNSDKGLAAMKGMQILTNSTAYDSNADIFTDAAVVVTGVWNAVAAATHFGENLAAAKLPSFTVDGTSYQLGSYMGFKMLGVKPQTDAKKAAVLSLLAQWLTNEENQLQRFDTFGWGPSNLKAAATEKVQTNIGLTALADQNQYAVQQGQIHGSWWDIAKLLGADAKAATDEAALKSALENYEAAINALLTKSDDELKAWGAIGTIGDTNWDTDFAMPEGPAGTYTSDVIAMKAGQEFKVRQGGSWDVNYGVDGVAGGANIVVEADGNYKVQLVLADGVATITLIPA